MWIWVCLSEFVDVDMGVVVHRGTQLTVQCF